jgi:glycogen operon protein
MLLFNAHHEPIRFTVAQGHGEAWETVIDTTTAKITDRPALKAGSDVTVEARALHVLRRVALAT